MVMRVWVLASCGSLLALSACSAEPTTTAQPSPLDPADDDLQAADRPSALDHTPGTAVDIDRALSRPELRPTRSQRPPIPSPARTQRTTLTPEQLRDRVERIRAQQIQRSPTPGRAAGMTQPRTPPQTSQADVADVSLRPGMVPTATLAITPLTPPPRPTPSSVTPVLPVASDTTTLSAATPATTQTNLSNGVAVFLGEESTQAADLGAPEPATLARNFPLRSTAHQSDGARHSQDSVVISVAQPSDLTDVAQREIADREATTAHHSPWLTDGQVASQPFFAQTEPQTRAEEASPSLALSSDTDSLAEGDSVQPELSQAESSPSEGSESDLAASPRAVVFSPSEPPTDLSLGENPDLSAPATSLVAAPEPELAPADPGAASPEPLPLEDAAPATRTGTEISGEGTPHWSALGPAVSVSAVPTSVNSPRFADSNTHQSSDQASDQASDQFSDQFSAMADPTAEASLTEPMAALPSAASDPHCERPTLSKPLPLDTLAESAIQDAKGIPAEKADEEIEGGDCP